MKLAFCRLDFECFWVPNEFFVGKKKKFVRFGKMREYLILLCLMSPNNVFSLTISCHEYDSYG